MLWAAPLTSFLVSAVVRGEVWTEGHAGESVSVGACHPRLPRPII